MKKLKWQILIKTGTVFLMSFAFFLTVSVQMTIAVTPGACGSVNHTSMTTIAGLQVCGQMCSYENCGSYWAGYKGTGTPADPWRWHCCPDPTTATDSIAWCMACDSYSHWFSSGSFPNDYGSSYPAYFGSCVPYACTGTLPANTSAVYSTTIFLTSDNTWDYASAANTNANRTCLYDCNSGYDWNGSTCVLNPYSCTGTVPAHASMYVNDNAHLTANTPYTYSANNTSAKCEYACDSYNNYVWDGTTKTCKQVSCDASGLPGGIFPTGASLYSNDDHYLTANTPYTYAGSDTTAKCEFSCNAGNTWDISTQSCVPIIYKCLNFPDHAVALDAEESTGLMADTSWTFWNGSSDNSFKKCEFKCNTGYNWDNVSMSCICPGINTCKLTETNACNDQSNCGKLNIKTKTASCLDSCGGYADLTKCLPAGSCKDIYANCPVCSSLTPGTWKEVAP